MIEKKTDLVKPIEVRLTKKQSDAIQGVLSEKANLQMQMNVISEKEKLLSGLILDAHDIDDAKLSSCELNIEGTMFRVIKKT